MSSFWQKIRSDFPITKKYIYLDHASGGPIPLPVSQAMQSYYKTYLNEGDLAWPEWVRRREEVRQKAARFVHADASEIAFTHSTSEGMNYIAELLAGEGAVLTNESEFPSSTLPWLWRKSKVLFQKEEKGAVPLDRLKKLLTPSVKTIVTSFVQYATGFRQDLAELGRIKGNRYLVVNATQGLGALSMNVVKNKIDFLCTNSYKWLLAGYGGGFLYIRKKWLEKFKPSSAGWRSMKHPEWMDNRRLELRAEAGRYEPGCPGFGAIFSMGAALDYLTGIGIPKIEKRILELTNFAREGLEKKGWEVLSPKEAKFRSGIVVFKVKEAKAICRRLLRKGIYVSARGGGIRVAPHFYNTYEEIERLLNAL